MAASERKKWRPYPPGALREAQLEERSAFAELEERTRFPGA
jgi:hypothetical protein